MPDVFSVVMQALLAIPRRGVVRIAVDGVDGVGKTTFADRLAARLKCSGHEAIRASVDGFHNPREIRYRQGKTSPEGFFRDSYDYTALRRHLLEPLGPGGTRKYRAAVFDHRLDAAVDTPAETAPDDALLIVDGIFLQRDELRAFWDFTIFLDAPFEVTIPRGASRGPDFGSPDPNAESNRRYVEGQKLYLGECEPLDRADIVIDNRNLAAPTILRARKPDADG